MPRLVVDKMVSTMPLFAAPAAATDTNMTSRRVTN